VTLLLWILAAYVLLFAWEFGCAFRRSRRAARAANFEGVRQAAAKLTDKGWAPTEITWQGLHPHMRMRHPTEGEWTLTTGKVEQR
jgi:hypothetical protein